MKKRLRIILPVLLSLLLIFSLSACGGGGTPAATEAPTEAATEAATEAVTEAPTEAATEAPTEAVTEAITEAATEEVTEAPASGSDIDLKAMLSDLLASMDPEKGLHLNYERHTEYMDATAIMDVHVKGESYYSSTMTKVSIGESTSISLVQDGALYSLDPEKKTGMMLFEDLPVSLLGGNYAFLDDLYGTIATRIQESDFTTGIGEIEGKTYATITYPKTEYQSENIFYFDDNGQLVYMLTGEPAVDVGIDIGETFYTINVIDDQVDESLFSLDGYEIEE